MHKNNIPIKVALGYSAIAIIMMSGPVTTSLV